MPHPLASRPDQPKLKKLATRVRNALEKRFYAGESIDSLLRARAAFIDCLIRTLFAMLELPGKGRPNLQLCLVAIGGYGRGELQPDSDIDLLLLVQDTPPPPDVSTVIEWLVATLWDSGLNVGHNVNTPSAAAELAAADLTMITTFMEARPLAGNRDLFDELKTLLTTDRMWNGRDFFLAKEAEQGKRRAKFGDVDANLEPNVKNSPGGLRDLQTIRWILLRQHGVVNLPALERTSFLQLQELSRLEDSRIFLERVRFALHSLNGRADDRLLLNHQRTLAKLFGYEDERYGQLAVEQFMQQYYWHVRTVLEINAIIFQFFRERVVGEPDENPILIPGDRFRVGNKAISVIGPNVFERHPSALLEIFVHMTRSEDIEGIGVGTIRQIRHALITINHDFRSDPRNTELFIDLLRGRRIFETLTLMQRYGVLGRYLPEFERVIGQMQHDLFHAYTVDAHTLQLVRNLQASLNNPDPKEFPVAAVCAKGVRKPELLYVAGLYHDIAKGRGGDHSALGAADVSSFCFRHRFSESDAELVRWLVHQHLLLSTTAQKRDIGDPVVIQEFASEVRTEERLDHLYLLTIADIMATNPKLWNGWRANLLRQLYLETRRALRRGLENPLSRLEQAAQHRQSALDRLLEQGHARKKIEAAWKGLEESYFMACSGAQIAWQTQALFDQEDDAKPFVVFQKLSAQETDDKKGATEMFVHASRQLNLFSVTATVLHNCGLSTQDARLHTSEDRSFGAFIVLGYNGQPLLDWQERQVSGQLLAALANPAAHPPSSPQIVPALLERFHLAPTVTVKPRAAASGFAAVEVCAANRPGLLSRLSRVFLEKEMEVRSARISTLGEMVEDTFEVRHREGDQVDSEDLRLKLLASFEEDKSACGER